MTNPAVSSAAWDKIESSRCSRIMISAVLQKVIIHQLHVFQSHATCLGVQGTSEHVSTGQDCMGVLPVFTIVANLNVALCAVK